MTEPTSPLPDAARPVPPTDADVPQTHPTGTVDEATAVPKAVDPAVSLQTAFGIPSASSSSITGLVNRTLGQYELLELLGQGGMGAVYKARHINLDKLVALKLLKADFMQSEESVARFKREMKAVGKISHPHIVQAFDAGQINGTHYLTMELVVGTDLHHLVKQRGPFPVKDACKAIRQAALGLHAAHKEGLVHRDIKPSNLLLAKNGQIKILDLGLALIGDGTPHEAITSTGQVLGTPDYMAPEQWEDTHATDPRTDLYALGCTLFYLLTGRAPYATDEYKSVVKKMSAHVHAPIPDLKSARPDVPDGVCALYQRLMSKRPEDRYASAAELAQALAPFSSSKGTESTAVPTSPAATIAMQPDASGPQTVISSENSANTATVTDVVTSDFSPPRRTNRKWLVGLAGVAALVLFGTIIINIKKPDGTTTKLIVPDETDVDLSQLPKGSKIQVSDSTPASTIGWHGWPADAPKPAIAPFDAEQAKKYQEDWAAYLKVPVEWTNSIKMKFRLIPPGEFMMGSRQEEIDDAIKIAEGDAPIVECLKREPLQHKVVLTQPFYLSITEVTQLQYEMATGAKPSRPRAEHDTSRYPVDRVSWNDAIDFCNNLSSLENLSPSYFRLGGRVTITNGDGYELPTEARWEFVRRSGDVHSYPLSAEHLEATGWITLNSGGSTHPVGLLQPNAFGLYDMIGNVWEWCEDWPSNDPTVQGHVATNPRFATGEQGLRVVRGNDFRWGDTHRCLICSRPSFRHSCGFEARDDCNGFRSTISVEAVRSELSRLANPQSAPPSVSIGAIDFYHERKVAERFLRMAKGTLRLANKERKPIGELKDALPSEAFCILGVSFLNADITDDELVVLAQASEIEDIYLASNPRITPSGFNVLASLRKLQSLDVSDTAINSESMSLLKNWPELRRLDLTATQIDDAGLDQLASCPRLEFLAVGKTKVTNDGLAKIQRYCPYLKELHIESDDNRGGPRAVSALKGFKYLRTVRCSADQLTSETLDALRALPQFEEIQLRSPTSNDAVALIAGLSVKLQRFECVTSADSDTGISAVGYQSLQRCRQLIHLQLGGKSGSPTDASLVELATLPNLQSIKLAFAEPARQYSRAGVIRFRELRPDVELTVDGKAYSALSDWPGKFEGSTSIEPWNLPADAPAPAVMPFTADEAVRHQAAWAQFLKLPIEQTSQATGMKFRLIPPSEMVIQRPEKSQVMVRMPTAYYIGETEVTIGQYKEFVEATGYKTLAEKNEEGRLVYNSPTSPAITWRTPGQESDDELPASVLSLEDCHAFCEWLSNKDGATYRLPTDSEWEVAARAGGIGSSGFLTKREEAVQYGWIAGISEMRSHPVASKLANPFGIYDVIGNAHEYVLGTALDSRTFVRGQNFNGSMWDELWNRWEAIHLGSDIGFRIVRQVTDEYESLPRFAEQPVLVERNSPLGPHVAVSRPVPISGLRSWSVELAGPRAGIQSIAWCPNAAVIATTSGDQSVQLWDRKGVLKSILVGQPGSISTLSFSPDGKKIASGNQPWNPKDPSSIRIWDVGSGKCDAVVRIEGGIWCVAWSPDNKHIASGTHDRIAVIDISTGRTVNIPVAGNSLCWSPDGKTICSGCADPSGARLVDPVSGKDLATLTLPGDAPQGGFYRFAWSPDGEWIAAVRHDRVHIWNARTRQHANAIENIDYHVSWMIWHPNNQFLAVGNPDVDCKVFNTVTGQIVTRINRHAGFAWSPDGSEFVSYGRSLDFFESDTGKLLFSGPECGIDPSHEYEEAILTRSGQRLQFKHTQISERYEFDAETGQLLERRKAPDGHFITQAFDERWRAYYSNEMRIEPTRFDQDPVSFQTPVTNMIWRPEPGGKQIAQAFGQEVRLWDTVTGKTVASLRHSAEVWSFEWSPNGDRIATIAGDKVVRIWDATTGQVSAQFKTFSVDIEELRDSWFSILAWSSDGKKLWIPIKNHVGLLDLSTGRVTQFPDLPNSFAVRSLTLAPDGERLLLRDGAGLTFIQERDGTSYLLGQHLGIRPKWCPDARRFVSGFEYIKGGIRGFDVGTRRRLGTLWPIITGNHWLCVGPTGHYRGSEGVEDQIVYVAQLDDGSNITLSPAEFAQRFGWKNDPNKATLLKLEE